MATASNNSLAGVPLGSLAEIRPGYQTRSRIEADASSPFRIIQLRDIAATVEWSSVMAFKPDVETERYLVADGDVLLSCRGGTNVGIALAGVPTNTVASSNFYILRIRRPDLLPAYLGWYLNQPTAQEFFRTRAQGTRTALLTKADLADLDVPIPPLPIQERVVRLAALRRTERELAGKLESHKELLMALVCQNAIHAERHTEA